MLNKRVLMESDLMLTDQEIDLGAVMNTLMGKSSLKCGFMRVRIENNALVYFCGVYYGMLYIALAAESQKDYPRSRRRWMKGQLKPIKDYSTIPMSKD